MSTVKNEAAWQPAIPVVPPKASANLQFNRLTSIEAFAGAHRLQNLPTKQVLKRRHRVWMKTAHRFHVDWAAGAVHDRRLAAVHLEPVLGSLLLRWGVELTRPRYAEVAPETPAPGSSA